MKNQILTNTGATINYRNANTKPLSPLQTLYVEAFFKHQGVQTKIAEDIGRSREQCYAMQKSDRVRLAISRRNTEMAVDLVKDPSAVVTKTERIELLWQIAQDGASKIYDKEGNEVMMAPATSVSAIRSINEMISGSLAPKEVEVTVKNDTRTESEIRANILKLTAEYNSLAVIEGVSESDIQEAETLPALDVEIGEDD